MKLSSLPAAFDVLRRGRALANPGLWKVVGMGASAGTGTAALAGPFGDFAVSLNTFVLGAFGHDLHLTKETGMAIGVVAAWAVGSLFGVATTDKLGILPAKPGASDSAAGDPIVEPVSDGYSLYPGDFLPGAVGAAARPTPVAGTAAAPLGGLPAEPGASDPVRGFSAADLQAP